MALVVSPWGKTTAGKRKISVAARTSIAKDLRTITVGQVPPVGIL